jgi:hypothetical protein
MANNALRLPDWEIGASSPEEFAAMSAEQIRAVMLRNIERGSHNPYEDY